MAEGLASAASVAWDKENMNATPGKDDTSGKVPDSALKRGRTVLAAIVPPSKEKPSKRRKSMKPGNRRVSFAPDDQLMTMHLYTKDDDRHATPEKGLWGDPSPKRTVFMDSSPGGPPSGGDPFLEPLHGWGTGRASHSPAVMASPTAVSMELTGGSQDGPYGRAGDMTGLSVLSGEMPPGSTGGITAGVPGLADILQEDLSADYSAREAHSEPPPRSSTPKQVLAPARSAPPIMALTPLTEETEADLRSTSHAYGQSGTNGQLSTGFLSTAGQDDGEQFSGLFGADDTSDNMSLTSSARRSPRDATWHSASHMSLGYTQILEGGHHPTWGEAANDTKALSMGQLTDELQELGPQDGQASKWGFVPGDDNTTDLDLERNGLALMGDITYRHVFQDTTTDTRRASTAFPAPLADITEDSPLGRAPAVQEPAQATLGQDSEAGSPRPAVIESEMPTEAEESMMAVLNVPSPGPRRQGRPNQNRRRSSMADLTGRLLADDSLDGPTGLAMLAPPGSAGGVAPPSSPEDSPADRVRHAGKDMTTGLLLEDTSAPGAADDDSGQLGQLRKKLNLLQGTQKPRESEGLGRQDSSGHLTLHLLPGSTTQLLAATQTAAPGHASADPDTSGLLAEMTMASAAGAQPADEAAAEDLMDEPAEDLLTPPAQQQAAPTPMSQVERAPEVEGRQPSPDLLEDESLHDMVVPPELPPRWAPALPGTEGTPLRALIPGGPLLARTPPPSIHRIRPSVTPMRALSAGSPSPSPMASQVSYPMPAQYTEEMEIIPGGPKLPRTPQGPQSVGGATSGGRTPAPSPEEGYAMSPVQLQQSPRVSFAPGSQASRQMSARQHQTPGNMIPSGHMLGRTPTSQMRLAPAPMTFQDFLKEVDLQFLDHMRRGTSINFADLASDPPPATMQERYRLLHLTAPAVEELEASIRKLREVIAAHKETIAEKEAEIGCNNPAVFKTLQGCSPAEADTVKEAVATLKRLCRQRTVLAWKQWRESIELETKAPALQATKAELDEEVKALAEAVEQLRSLGKETSQLADEAARATKLDSSAYQEEAARRERLLHARASLAEEQRGNAARATRREAAGERLAVMQAQRAELEQERERLQAALAQRQTAAAVQQVPDASVGALLEAADMVELQGGLVGWRIERLAQTEAGGHSVAVRMGPFFRLKLEIPGDGPVSGALELTQPGEAPAWQERHRGLVAGLAAALLGKNGQGSGPLMHIAVEEASSSAFKAMLLEMKTQVGRIADIVADVDSLRLRFPKLASIRVEDGSLSLSFLNLAAQLKFSVSIPMSSLLQQDGELACSAKVHFPGNTGLQAAAVEAAVQGMPCGHGRLLLACGRLAELAEAKTGSAAALSGSAATSGACNSEAADETAPLNVFSNPLYTCATPKHVC